ncbi:phage tail tape measure protein [Sphingobacterium sp.]|uniref:phage tail tape measure protein n=1 Tax=Sphingobacterium sp. TaxID=341027 RepID=UPI00289F0287|nr:phage tail tape measure protein [Sphingobacterium sp.]
MAEVKFKFTGDDSELRKKLAGLAKLQAEMSDQFAKNLIKKISGTSADPIKGMADAAKKSSTAVRQLSEEQKKLKAAQLENIESIRRLREERSKEISDLNVLKQLEQDAKTVLAEKKAATQDFIKTEKELNIQYKQGQIAAQEYNRKLKEQAEERRKNNAVTREAEKIAKAAEKARKDAEREAEKQRKAAEKRRKELEKESSEYYQLNKALNNVRKEAKDVLAEMFKLERQGLQTSAAYEDLENKSKDLVKETQLLDRGIKKIDATLGLHQRNVGDYGQAFSSISPIYQNIDSALSVLGTSIKELAEGGGSALSEFGATLLEFGKDIGKFLISPIGIAISVLTGLFLLFQRNKQTVIDFNDGLLNVSKTTGLSGTALQSFSDDIIKLSRALKTVSTDKLLEYASVAGQLGVKGSQNILAFSEALAKLETASDISGEEGASQIARLLQLVDGGVSNIKAFGDEIVQLGNNFPATESEILANATRIAQSTGIYKLGRQEILAYATATKSVGVEAELVGSTLGRTLGVLEKTIRSGKGLDEVLRLVGGSQTELSNRFREDASGVLMDFIGGLNRTSTTASDFNKSLEAVGITAQRDRDVIGSLASKGYATLADAMGQVKDATGSMDAEFGTASEKLINQSERISIAWNNFVLGIENGQGKIGKASVAVIAFIADTIDAMSGNVAESDKLLDSYRKLESQTSSTDKSVRPLLSRYDELKSKTTLNKDEHNELREIIKRVAELIPSAVTEFDKYGQAIDINKKKITQFNDAQKQLVKDMNISTRKALSVELEELKRQRDQITSVQNNSLNNDKGTSFISRLARIGLSDEKRLQGIQDRTEKIAVITDKIKSNLQKQRDLGGTLSPQDRAFMSQFDPANSSTTTNSNKQEEVVRKNKEYWEKIVTDTQEAIDALEVSQKGSDIWNSLSKKLADAQKNVDKYSLSKDQTAAKSASKATEEIRKSTERQRSLQLEIDKINETASRNQITRNESEVASIKDKYAKIREEVRKFYADPKNKGLRVDESGLRRSENFEVSEATTRQDTKSLTESLSVQKQLLDEYNAYAEQTSKEEADKRYAGQLASFKGYKERLSKEYMDLITLEKTSASGEFQGSAVKLTQAQEERAKALRLLLDSLDKEERDRDNKKVISALQSAKTLNDKLLDIEREYQEKVKSLKDAGQFSEEKGMQLRREMTQKYANEIDSSPEFQKAMKNIDESLGSMIGAAYRHGKDVVFGLIDGIKGATEEQKAELRKLFGKFFDEGAKNADLGNLQNIAQAAQGFGDLAKSSLDFASGLNDAFSTLENMVGIAGQLAGAMSSLSKNKNSQALLQGVGQSMGIYGAALQVGSALSSYFNQKREAENKKVQQQIDYNNERQLKSTEAITKMLERQLELMDKIYGVERLEKYGETLVTIQKNFDDANSKIAGRYLMTQDESVNEILKRLNNGETRKQILNSIGPTSVKAYNAAKKVLDDLDKYAKTSSLSVTDLSKSLSEAQSQLTQLKYNSDLGLTDEFTSNLIDQLQNQIDLYRDTINKLKEETTGNSFSSILSNLSDLFFNSGLDSADAWSKGFDSVMKNYAIQKFSRDYLEKAAQDWYDLFDQLADGGITESERDSLKNAWDKIQEEGQKRADELGQIIGNDSGSGLSSSIQKELTEATASELTGLYRSTFELNKRMFDETKSQGLTLSKQVIIATDQLAALNAIQTNTFNTVSELKNAVGELKSINKNLGGRY